MPVEKRIEAQDAFSFLRLEQANTLSNAAEVITYKAGDTVYFQGETCEHAYVVLDGEVVPRLPGKGGISVPIDQATPGVMFGSCKCFDIDAYTTTAQCTRDSRIMKIKADVLQRLGDEDLRMRYATQRRMSQIYFKRYLDTMRKL